MGGRVKMGGGERGEGAIRVAIGPPGKNQRGNIKVDERGEASAAVRPTSPVQRCLCGDGGAERFVRIWFFGGLGGKGEGGSGCGLFKD